VKKYLLPGVVEIICVEVDFAGVRQSFSQFNWRIQKYQLLSTKESQSLQTIVVILNLFWSMFSTNCLNLGAF